MFKILSQIPKLILTLFLELIGCFIVLGILVYRVYRDKPLATSFPKAFSWFDNQNAQYGPDPEDLYEVWYWLCLRNPLNKFQWEVLGFEWTNDIIIVQYDEKPDVSQLSAENTSGSWYTEVKKGNKTYWEYFLVKKWPFMNKCFRFRCGWKIGRLETNFQGNFVQWCFTPTLFKEIGT